MSHIPRMTFIGAYDYDPQLFDNLTFPTGIEKNLAVNTFLMRFGECPMLYTDLRFQKLAFSVWSDKWHDGIERMLIALESEYNPLHNFDRYEDYSESELTSETTDYTGSETTAYTGSETTAYTGSETTAYTGSETTNYTGSELTNYTGSETTDYTGSETVEESSSETTSETTENQVSAYNASTYQPDKKTTTDKSTESESERTTERDLTDTHTRNLTDNHSRSLADSHNRNLSDNHSRNLSDNHSRNLSDSHTRSLKDSTAGDRSMNHIGHLYGNIGLTTSQQMILAELDLRGKYNIYDLIAELLRGEFCLYYY